MMCSNSYRNHYIKVGQHPKCVVSSIERAGQSLVKQTVSSAEICMKGSEESSNTIAVPEGVDAELLMKVLGNPEMAALLTSLARTMKV